jgi:predicted enzyme related to lactoylglutathione lyase
MAHGDYAHIEVPADDLPRARAFYEGAFGWTFEEPPGMSGYLLYRTPSGEFGGGMGVRGDSAPDAIRNYLLVTSVEASLARATELGGRVVEGKQEIPGFGWFGVVADTEGNQVGIFEASPR